MWSNFTIVGLDVLGDAKVFLGEGFVPDSRIEASWP
jgi:hypothetical protein